MADTPHKSTFRFLLVWLAVPTFLRILTLACLAPRFENWQMALETGGWALLLAAPQDLFIALQALLAVLFIRALMPRRLSSSGTALLGLLATLVFTAVQAYLLFDFMLYTKTGIRMDAAFLDFLPAASSFASSAWELGVAGLLAALAALLVAQPRIFRIFRGTAASLRFSWAVMFAMPLAGLLAAYSRDHVPADVAYAVDNLVLSDQTRLIASWLDPLPSLSQADEAEAIKLLTPQAEKFERVSPRYPLLKRTHGFHGQKQFDIRVAPDDRPHVIFLFLESFRAKDVGALGGKFNASPNFDRLAKEGVLFSNFYANGVQTTRAVVSSLFGVPPCFSIKSAQASNSDLPLIGVPDLLAKRGYATAYITGASLEFESKREFFSRHGFQEIHGEDQVGENSPNARGTSWGYHDEYLMEYLAHWLGENDRRGQPAFATVFTISHHHPWYVPEGYTAPRFDTGGNQEYARFLQTFHYTDHCLGQLMRLLRRDRLDRKTILFVIADTGAPQGDHGGNYMMVHDIYEECIHIPLLILAPGRLQDPTVINDVASQVDLLPTVMDVLGMSGLNHAVGTSLQRHVPNRRAYINNPFVLRYHAVRSGAEKFVYTLRSKDLALFKLDDDPSEHRNLAPQFSGRARAYLKDASIVNQFMSRLYISERLASPQAAEEYQP